MKAVILSWLQNDGTRGFSVDQLKGKQPLLTFRPDALVVFRAKVLVFREPPSSINIFFQFIAIEPIIYYCHY